MFDLFFFQTLNAVCYYACFHLLDDCPSSSYKPKRRNDINSEIKSRAEVKNKDKRDIIMSSSKEDKRMVSSKTSKRVSRKRKSKISIKEKESPSQISALTNDNAIVEGGGDKCQMQTKPHCESIKETGEIWTTLNNSRSTANFAESFLKKVDVKRHIPPPESDDPLPYIKTIGGISVCDDNLIWVNYTLHRHVKLFTPSGEVLKTVRLDDRCQFTCCLPPGDLLLTQGTMYGSQPIITLVQRTGDVRAFANLCSFAKNLLGILYQDDRIYVIGHRTPKKDFIITLNMDGVVQTIIDTKPDKININHIISYSGRIVAVSTDGFAIFPLETASVSSKEINKVHVNHTYSKTACFDNFGNLIIGLRSEIFVTDPSLERSHEIQTGFPVLVTSTAVDKQNQLWIGIGTGDLYITEYLNK